MARLHDDNRPPAILVNKYYGTLDVSREDILAWLMSQRHTVPEDAIVLIVGNHPTITSDSLSEGKHRGVIAIVHVVVEDTGQINLAVGEFLVTVKELESFTGG